MPFPNSPVKQLSRIQYDEKILLKKINVSKRVRNTTRNFKDFTNPITLVEQWKKFGMS
jgi:hypothetical protein